jgi:hypothetical protein
LRRSDPETPSLTFRSGPVRPCSDHFPVDFSMLTAGRY